MSKQFHASVSLDALLKMDDEAIKSLTNRDPKQMRAYAIELQIKGFEVLPPCDNTDAKGNCLGHDQKTGQSESSSLYSLIAHAVARDHAQDATCELCQELAQAANTLRKLPGLNATNLVMLFDALEQISAGLNTDSTVRRKIAEARKPV